MLLEHQRRHGMKHPYGPAIEPLKGAAHNAVQDAKDLEAARIKRAKGGSRKEMKFCSKEDTRPFVKGFCDLIVASAKQANNNGAATADLLLGILSAFTTLSMSVQGKKGTIDDLREAVEAIASLPEAEDEAR